MAAAPNPLGALFGGGLTGGSAGPSAAGGTNTSGYDASGWNVNFGSGSIDSTRSDSGDMGQYLPYVLAGVGLLIVWRLTRKR